MDRYDICILGAGISGLYCARELHIKYPTQSICVLEKYESIGGRIATFRENGIQFEQGAGRIHKTHRRILDLLNEYKIDVYPISGELPEYRTVEGSTPIDFGKCLENLPFSDLAPDVLSTHTLKELLRKTGNDHDDIISRYEYSSELDTLRADKAIESLKAELGSHTGFCVVKDGFSKIIRALKETLESMKVPILRKHEVTNLVASGDHYKIQIKGLPSILAKKVVVTLPRDALADLPYFKDLPILKHVKMRPLVRIYAIFPLEKGKAWFTNDLRSFICEPPVRYFIPLNPEKGTCMISYTDGSDAEYWIRNPKNPEVRCMKQIRSLFPHLTIPDPIYCKVFSWTSGCSYWTPGLYSTNDMLSIRPAPNLYLCGESWAEKQCWVESALESADEMLAIY